MVLVLQTWVLTGKNWLHVTPWVLICLLLTKSILTERLLRPSNALVYKVENFAAVIVDNPIKTTLHDGEKFAFVILRSSIPIKVRDASLTIASRMTDSVDGGWTNELLFWIIKLVYAALAPLVVLKKSTSIKILFVPGSPRIFV